MPSQKVKEFLNKNHIHYESIRHTPEYTSLELAHANHVPEKAWAKVVVLKVDDHFVMVVLPANEKVNLEAFQAQTGAHHVSLSSEEEFQKAFPGCEPGAMPPFGNLYNMETFVDETLTGNEQIACNAGSHSELIKISFADFSQFVHPIIIKCAIH